MEVKETEGVGQKRSAGFSQEGLVAFTEGVKLCLGRWTALQLAVENQWGGTRSLDKAHQFHSDIVSWMANSQEDRYIDELETLLDDNMISLFNAEIEDGSLEEVAEQIMYLHEECLEGNYGRLELLSASSGVKGSRSANEQENDDSDDFVHEADECSTHLATTEEKMVIDSPQDEHVASKSLIPSNNQGDSQEILTAEEVADGWQIASKGRRRSRSKK